MSKAVLSAKKEPTPKKEPTYGLVDLFPYQGDWTEAEYLELTGSINHFIELSNERLEFLPMPSERHQQIVTYLLLQFYSFVLKHNLGMVLVAPFKVKLWEGKIREPDIVFMHKDNASRRGEQMWQGADLVVEVISPDDPQRDTVVKFEEYAKAGVSEYWLVDPRDASVTVYTLPKGEEVYEEVSKQNTGQACSNLLAGLCVDVKAVFKQDEKVGLRTKD